MAKLVGYSLGCCGILPLAAPSSKNGYASNYNFGNQLHHSAAVVMFKRGDEVDLELQKYKIEYDIIKQEDDYITAIIIYNPAKEFNKYDYGIEIK